MAEHRDPSVLEEVDGLAEEQNSASPTGDRDKPRDGPTAVDADEEEQILSEAIEENGCSMMLFAWLLNPTGNKSYFGISAWGHP